MDTRELQGLLEAYNQIHTPQEVDEAVKGASPHTMQMRKDAAAERKAGIKPLPAKEGEKYAKYKMAQMAYAKRKREMDEELDIFDVVLEFLQAEGYAETLEEAEWLMANVINEEAIDIILGEAITSERGKAKAAEMIAKRTTASGRAKSGQGDNVALIKHIGRSNRDGLLGTPPNRKVAGRNWPKSYTGTGGTGNKAARRAGLTPTRENPNAWKEEVEFDIWDVVLEYLITNGHADTNEEALYVMSQLDEETIQGIVEAQHARENPEKYEREQRSKETKGQSAERRVRDRLSTMDPEKAAKMKAQMRAVGLNV